MKKMQSATQSAAMACLAWLGALGLAASTAHAALPAPVAAAMDAAQLPHDAMAARAELVQANGPVFDHQSLRAMQPASTMKLVTSTVALARLGPNHRGFTALWTAAPQAGEVLQGDLVLQGGADPELNLPQLWALLAELRYQGIRTLAGNLVVDRHLFRPARMDLDVPAFDSAPEFEYNVIPDALHMASSLMPLELKSGDAMFSIRGLPALPGVAFDTGALRLVDHPCKDWDDVWQTPQLLTPAGPLGEVQTIVLQGAFPKNCSQRARLQLVDRQVLTEKLFRVVWEGLGGRWQGRAVEGTQPEGARELARRPSRPWGELLRHLNKTSDNAWTRLLYLSLGLRAMATDATTPTAELARREVLAWFAETGIDANGLVLDNGSGLSRTERITPQQMVRVLQAAQRSRHASELMMSLPLAGEDGSMARRFPNGPAALKARLKPGTLRNVVALAGYVTDVQGRMWALDVVINHDDAAKGRAALDAFVQWVAAGSVQ